MSQEQASPVVHEDLLIELGCEELPPKALNAIREALFSGLLAELDKNNISYDADTSRSFSTPRRLAALIRNVASHQPDLDQERRGPAVTVAFDADGKPSGAAIGFARSVGKEVAELETIRTDKGEWLFAKQHIPGKSLADLIYPILEQALKNLPIPKPMRWGDHDFSFVRPVHWLIVMHGDDVLPGSLLGLKASNKTRGHRVHAPGPHLIQNPSAYTQVLKEAFVLVDQEQREKQIRQMLDSSDHHVHVEPGLLAEVNNLVEWPVAVECAFDEEFLEAPHAALIASMQDHQKFFPIMASATSAEISNRFISISNIESTQPTAVREGFERVIRPRLADARFFLHQDLKHPLISYFDRLNKVVFQKKIGTIGDKSKRIASISKQIAEFLNADLDQSSRAATLSKCDLMTQMVGEFPELQGVMGHHYALASGEHPVVAVAIEEHYAPRFAGDNIPASAVGRVVGIADRLDTLVGIFAAGLRPTGNKDPFALRRAALGLVRILLEANVSLPVRSLLALVAAEYSGRLPIEPDLLDDIHDFIVERTRNYYREQGFNTELVNATIVSPWDSLPDLDSRVRALAEFMGEDAASSLAAANKRIGNILRKSGNSVSTEIGEDRFVLEEESRLFEEIKLIQQRLDPLLESADYAASLKLLAGLKEAVDSFFEGVMVMDEDPLLRANRLALLALVKSLFDRIADLSVLG